MQLRRTNWIYLGREALLVLLLAYVMLAGGTLTGLIDNTVRLVSGLLAVLLLGAWLLARLFGRRGLPRTGLERAWLLFVGAQALAILFSEDPRRSLPAGLIWVTYVLVFYLAYDLLRSGWPAELFEKALLIAGAIVIGLGLYQLVSSYQAWQALAAGLPLAPSFHLRLTSLVGDANLLAAVVNLLLPLAFTRALANRHRLAQIVLALFWLLGLVVLYFTDSRGGLLGLGMGLFVIGLGWMRLLSPRARQLSSQAWAWLRARRWILTTIVVLIIIAGVLAGFRILAAEGSTTHAPVASARDIYWQAAAAAFRSAPITGVGPGIYPVYLMQAWSTPPARPYLHAHSTPFNIGAEGGLLAFFALFILLGAILRRGWGGWRGRDAAGQARWIGIAAALAGFSLHSLVDDFLPFPVVGLMLMLLLALWLAPAARADEQQGVFSPLWLLLPGLAAMLLGTYGLRANAAAADAVRAYDGGDTLQAAEGMERAAALDPSFGLYWQQAGYAYGRLSQESAAYSDLAISTYQRGIEIEPIYGLNYANLAALYAQEGLWEQAQAAFEEASGRSPESALIWLNQGALLEELGDLDGAEQSYLRALELEPEIDGIAFWQRTDFRQDLLAALDAPQAEAATSRQLARQQTAEARALLAASELDQAETRLAEAHRLDDQHLDLYLGLAELALARGEAELAQGYLDVIQVILATSNEAKVEALLLQAEILEEQGQSDEALSLYELVYDAILSRNVYGWGARGWTPYSYFVWLRLSFPEDLLPQLQRVDIPISIAQRLLALAEIYEGMGMDSDAAKVRESLQPYLP